MEFLISQKILSSENYSLAKILGDSVLMQMWTISCLPNDNHSIENAIILKLKF
jgi:hypothetical protein